MWKDEYHAYLETAEWRARREERLRFAGYRCEVCNSDERVQAHHRTYKNVGREMMTDLVALCRECHKRHHGMSELIDPGRCIGRCLLQEGLTLLVGPPKSGKSSLALSLALASSFGGFWLGMRVSRVWVHYISFQSPLFDLRDKLINILTPEGEQCPGDMIISSIPPQASLGSLWPTLTGRDGLGNPPRLIVLDQLENSWESTLSAEDQLRELDRLAKENSKCVLGICCPAFDPGGFTGPVMFLDRRNEKLIIGRIPAPVHQSICITWDPFAGCWVPKCDEED